MENYDTVETNEEGTTYYTLRGKLHRTDGPAIEWADGYRAWYQNGKQHREDGPAVKYPDGYREYWVHGIRQPDQAQ